MFSEKENLDKSNSKEINKPKKYYDITLNISGNLATFPGDPCYQAEQVYSLEDGSHFRLNKLFLGNHTGTHIDFPSHVIKDGKTSSDFSIESLIGTGLIIEVPEQDSSVTKDFIKNLPILKNDFVFFKTANSRISKYAPFTEKYVYIESDAAEELLMKGVKIVGIDYMSVDKYESEDLPVHQCLLSNDVLIVEGLDLNNVPVGRCKIYIMPIKINDMDGLPARVIAKL